MTKKLTEKDVSEFLEEAHLLKKSLHDIININTLLLNMDISHFNIYQLPDCRYGFDYGFDYWFEHNKYFYTVKCWIPGLNTIIPMISDKYTSDGTFKITKIKIMHIMDNVISDKFEHATGLLMGTNGTRFCIKYIVCDNDKNSFYENNYAQIPENPSFLLPHGLLKFYDDIKLIDKKVFMALQVIIIKYVPKVVIKIISEYFV